MNLRRSHAIFAMAILVSACSPGTDASASASPPASSKLSILLAVLTLAACSSAGPPAWSESAVPQSESAVLQSSMRAFGEEDVTELLLQDGDIAGVKANHDGPAGPTEELSDAEWTEHLADHGLKGRWWSGLTTGEGVPPLGYPFIIGGRVSLWADAEAAGEALVFENNTPLPGTRILVSHDVPELGDEAACAVFDWGELSDRAWCRFAVANATFDLYIRTGERLDPRAIRDLADLALRLRQRAESFAVADR